MVLEMTMTQLGTLGYLGWDNGWLGVIFIRLSKTLLYHGSFCAQQTFGMFGIHSDKFQKMPKLSMWLKAQGPKVVRTLFLEPK